MKDLNTEFSAAKRYVGGGIKSTDMVHDTAAYHEENDTQTRWAENIHAPRQAHTHMHMHTHTHIRARARRRQASRAGNVIWFE